MENLFKAGDAANMVNPISRAGILEAMKGGQLAAEAALAVIELRDEAQKQPFYKAFKDKWDAAYGNANLRIHRAKAPFSEIEDKTFDKAAGSLARIPVEKVTMSQDLPHHSLEHAFPHLEDAQSDPLSERNGNRGPWGAAIGRKNRFVEGMRRPRGRGAQCFSPPSAALPPPMSGGGQTLSYLKKSSQETGSSPWTRTESASAGPSLPAG